MYLSIDPSPVNVGVALLQDQDTLIKSTTIVTKERDNYAISFLEIVEELENFVDFSILKGVTIEQPTFQGRVANTKPAIGTTQMVGVLLYLLAKHRKTDNILFLSSKQVKSICTNDGNADKKKIKIKIEELFNYKPKLDHEADAIAIGYAGLYYRNERIT